MRRIAALEETKGIVVIREAYNRIVVSQQNNFSMLDLLDFWMVYIF